MARTIQEERLTDAQPMFDRDTALMRAMDDRDLLKELIELFLQSLPHQLSAIEQALVQQDRDTMAAEAHQLKGAAATLGMQALAGEANAVEQAARAGQQASAPIRLARLRREARRLSDHLQAHPL